MSGWMLPNSGPPESASDSGPDGSPESAIPVPIHCSPLSDKESANAKEECLNFDLEPIYKSQTLSDSEPGIKSTFSNVFAKFM